MTCTICGRYAEPDRETGYDLDEPCPNCGNQTEDESIDPIESDLHDLGSVLASLADLVKDCYDPDKLFDVYCELGKLSKVTAELQDAVGNMQLTARREEIGKRQGQ